MQLGITMLLQKHLKIKTLSYGEQADLTDIFEQGLLNKRIERDFTETADPMSAILSIKMIDDKTIELSYYSGADYSERTENITL